MADDFKAVEFLTDASGVQPFDVELIEGSEEISGLYTFSVQLRSKQKDVKLEDMVRHKPASIASRSRFRGRRHDSDEAPREIHGVPSSLRDARHGQQDRVRYRGDAGPALLEAPLRSRAACSSTRTVTEIVKEVLDAEVAGKKLLTSNDYKFKLNLKPDRSASTSCSTRNRTSTFISRWLESEGIFYFFEQTEDGDILVFADDPGGVTAPTCRATPPSRSGRRRGTRRGRARKARRRRPRRPYGRSSAATSAVPAKVVLTDYNYRTPAADMRGRRRVDSKDDGLVYQLGEHYKDQLRGEGPREGPRGGDQVPPAGLRRQERTCRSFRAGSKFTIAEHSSDFNGESGSSRESSHLRRQTFASTIEPASGYIAVQEPVRLHPRRRLFRPERKTAWPRVAGSCTAPSTPAATGSTPSSTTRDATRSSSDLDRSDRKEGRQASRPIRMAQPYGGPAWASTRPTTRGPRCSSAHADGDPDRPVIVSSHPEPVQPQRRDGGEPDAVRLEERRQQRDPLRGPRRGASRSSVTPRRTATPWSSTTRPHQMKHDQTIEVTNDRTKTITGNQSEHVVKDKTSRSTAPRRDDHDGTKTLTVHGTHTETIDEDVTITEGSNKTETIATNSSERRLSRPRRSGARRP